VGSRPESRREALLHELCVHYGYCNDLGAKVLTNARSSEDVVQAVLVAEGLDPATFDRKIQASLLAAVDDWLFDPQGRGGKSKLRRVRDGVIVSWEVCGSEQEALRAVEQP